MTRADRRIGLLLAAVDAVGIAVSIYLAVVELAGGIPACGGPGTPLGGCETVARSSYSHVAGIPVALFGIVGSAVLLGLALAWWQSGDRRALALHYGGSLLGVIFEAYLVYLQLFVLHAVCIWCATYGLSVILGFALALIAWVRTPEGAG